MSNKFSDGIDEIKKSLAFDFRKTTILDAIDSEITQLQNENERLMRRNDAQRILIQTLYQDLDNNNNIDDAVKNGMVAILEGLIAQLKNGAESDD
jgi:HEAT repeat protein